MNRDDAVKYAYSCLSSAQRPHHVHAHLMDHGFSRQEAQGILQQALDEMQSVKCLEKKRLQIRYRLAGLVFVLIGLAVLIYTMKTSTSGTALVVPAGLIGYGAYMLATGDYRPTLGH